MGCGASTPEMSEMEKAATFRERRLSISQVPAQGAPRKRRLSIYGSAVQEGQPSEVQSPCAACGCKTMEGLQPVPGGATSKINQDRGIAIYPWRNDPKVGLFGVYDGHGRAGEKVSEFVIQNLPDTLKELMEQGAQAGSALSEAYIRVDDDLGRKVDSSVSGTTAVTMLIKNNHLWIANSGDSRAIVVRKKRVGFQAIDLTIDQKPDTPAEMRRILRMGGHVTPPGANGSPSRVWHNLRGLAMARSIGDHAAATVGVIADPEISEYDCIPADYAIVIASDGVWEFLSSQNVADIIASVKSGDVQEMSELIVQKASDMWMVEEGDYRDDITVVILKLPWIPETSVVPTANGNEGLAEP